MARTKMSVPKLKITNFAWGLLSPYCPWKVTDNYVEFGSYRADALKKVFDFCSSLRLRFERSESYVLFNKRYNFKIYFS